MKQDKIVQITMEMDNLIFQLDEIGKRHGLDDLIFGDWASAAAVELICHRAELYLPLTPVFEAFLKENDPDTLKIFMAELNPEKYIYDEDGKPRLLAEGEEVAA